MTSRQGRATGASMLITTGAIAEAMNLEMTPALAREIGKRLKCAGWARRLITRSNGTRVWAYESIVRGHSAVVTTAVNDLLEQHTIEYYQRKSGVQPRDFGGGPIECIARAIADAAGETEIVDHKGTRSVVMPLLMWQSIVNALPGIEDK